MSVNVRPQGKVRGRDGLPIREGGVEMNRHNRWLLKNGSLVAGKPAPKPKPVKKEKADG